MRVLVADDDPLVRGAIRAGLATGDVAGDVVETGDGSSALALLRAQSVDVVVCDVSLPGADGFEIVREVREDHTYGDPAVLIVTDRGGEEDRVLAYRLGADGYLTKPIDPDDLFKAVMEAAERSPQQRQALRLEELGRAEFFQRLEQGFGQ